MFSVVHSNYDVISEVYHDQTMLFVVRLDYNIVFEVYYNQKPRSGASCPQSLLSR